jgi:hypothetical protein
MAVSHGACGLAMICIYDEFMSTGAVNFVQFCAFIVTDGSSAVVGPLPSTGIGQE